VNGRKAKELRRLAKYSPNDPREYDDIPVKKVKIARFNADGSVEDVIKTRTVRLNKNKQAYNMWKKAYYITKKGGL
jgi:hypothetical protein